MVLQRLSNREKVLLAATIIAVLTAFIYSLILEPLTYKWKDLDAQIAQKTLKLNKNLKILQKERWIKEEFQKYARHTKSLGTDEEVIAALLKIIEQKASSTSTRITNVRPRVVKDTHLYKIFAFEVISESSLEELVRFMYELQNSEELLKVKRLTLTLKSSQPQVLKGVIGITKISLK